MKSLALALALAACAPAAVAQTLALKGPTGQTLALSAAELAAMPHVGFTFDAHGRKHAYEGVPLIDLLARVGTPTGKALGGKALADAVRVTASDGYQVVFGLGEIDPGTRPNRIIVADRADGAPLGPKSGPFQLVVEGDLRPARSARMVTRIEVLALASP
ncbi:MAG: molybdopterin-binding oxidoreductase [Phenylobacterium sp.]|uniref:molybdopterin-dependent oxidoreductase n=1 Tax=Phenylobacterium sp. TaxID=1871053 RepID=UPI0025DC363C|nr:molybdopterin-dependent oxidoreductase [Phenylobacterium sp.]MBI1198404.1 molybdopterin-binding oxidoreductase [Phenylobacterium sp.]